jgi:hypothetical protein
MRKSYLIMTNKFLDGEYSEKTYRRQYGKSVEFIKFHAETIKTASVATRQIT